MYIWTGIGFQVQGAQILEEEEGSEFRTSGYNTDDDR